MNLGSRRPDVFFMQMYVHRGSSEGCGPQDPSPLLERLGGPGGAGDSSGYPSSVTAKYIPPFSKTPKGCPPLSEGAGRGAGRTQRRPRFLPAGAGPGPGPGPARRGARRCAAGRGGAALPPGPAPAAKGRCLVWPRSNEAAVT